MAYEVMAHTVMACIVMAPGNCRRAPSATSAIATTRRFMSKHMPKHTSMHMP